MESILSRVDILSPDDCIICYTNNLIIKFMINFCENKDAQFNILNNALTVIVNNRETNDKRKIIVFSFNPLEPEIPYETGYYVEDVKDFFLAPF